MIPEGYVALFGGVLGGLIGFLFGGWNTALTIFLVIQILDVISGLLQAFQEHNLNSSIMRKGLVRKFAFWIAIILAHFVDLILFNGKEVALTGIVFSLIGQEAISIIENLGSLGVILPPALTKYFIKIKDKSIEDTEDNKKK